MIDSGVFLPNVVGWIVSHKMCVLKSKLQDLRRSHSELEIFAEAAKLKWGHFMTGVFNRRENGDTEADRETDTNTHTHVT